MIRERETTTPCDIQYDQRKTPQGQRVKRDAEGTRKVADTLKVQAKCPIHWTHKKICR